MTFNPNWVSSPSETIRDIINYNNFNIEEIIDILNAKSINAYDLLEGRTPIDIHIANTLSEIFKNSSEFWLNKQKIFNQRIEMIDSIEKDEWVNSFPIKEIADSGYLESKTNLYNGLLNFFEVNSIFEWKIKYLNKSNLSFRKSEGFDSKKSSVVAWFRIGELHIKNIKYPKYNREGFLIKLENEIKQLTRTKSPKVFIPKLIEICYECGVILSIQRAPERCKVYGVTNFTKEGNPLLILSFRYLTDDQFWFTFFHEAGHVILHEKKFLNFEVENLTEKNVQLDEEELEANLFAEEALIPLQLKERLGNINGNKKKLLLFAMDANVSAGIVVGQLQKKGLIKPAYLNGYKRRYDIDDIKNSFKHSIENLAIK